MPQLAFQDHAQHVQSVLDAVLAAADPGDALARAWSAAFQPAPFPGPCVLIAAGKASVPMAKVAIERLGARPEVGVVVAIPGVRPPQSFHAANIRLFEADHPLPTQRNLIAAQGVADAARIAGSRKLPLIALISGGASAHLTLPERGLTLSDVRSITDTLLKSGAAISELNTVRKKLEQLKGGGLARCAHGAPIHAFILSDVLGDPVDVIASGPTAEDHSTIADAIRIIESRCDIRACAHILDHLRKREKLPPRDFPPSVSNTVIASNRTALDAARLHLERLGFLIAEARTGVEGEARDLGAEFAARVLDAQRTANGPVAVLWGGESTVTVRSSAGFGGRNQEAATSAAMAIAGRSHLALTFFATDGVDGLAPPGSPPLAGATITGESLAAARRLNIAPQPCLDASNAHAFVEAASAALRTGPTGTNINDIWIGLAYPA